MPTEFIVARIREAIAARTDPDLLIIGRTNSLRLFHMDDALRRAEVMHKAGADMLFVQSRTPDEMRIIGERLAGPLIIFAPADGFAGFDMTEADLAGLGFRLVASSGPCTRRSGNPTNASPRANPTRSWAYGIRSP